MPLNNQFFCLFVMSSFVFVLSGYWRTSIWELVGQMGYNHDILGNLSEMDPIINAFIEQLGQSSWGIISIVLTIVGSCLMWNIPLCSLSDICKRILFHWQMWMVFCVSLVWLWIPVTSPLRWCWIGYSCLLTDLCFCVKELTYHFVPCSSVRIE